MIHIIPNNNNLKYLYIFYICGLPYLKTNNNEPKLVHHYFKLPRVELAFKLLNQLVIDSYRVILFYHDQVTKTTLSDLMHSRRNRNKAVPISVKFYS